MIFYWYKSFQIGEFESYLKQSLCFNSPPCPPVRLPEHYGDVEQQVCQSVKTLLRKIGRAERYFSTPLTQINRCTKIFDDSGIIVHIGAMQDKT